MPLSSREVLKRLLLDGWEIMTQSGSHVQLKHTTKVGKVTVPHPRKDLPLGTLKSIEKQANTRLR